MIKSSLLQTIQRPLVLDSLYCEGVKHDWLRRVASYSIQDLDYTNLQLSYVDSEGNNSTCVAGWEDLPYLSRKVDNDTIFSYASVTKIFTSELVLDLVRKEKIKLDDKLVSFLPELIDKKLEDTRVADISISDLLSHRAGFDRRLTSDTMLSTLPWCPYKIEALQHITLDFEPNSKSVYSNLGYCLLAQVIENIHSKSYLEISRNYFDFKNSSFYYIQEQQADAPIVPRINQNESLEIFDFFALLPVGGLVGNSNDLSRYIYNMDKRTYPNITSRTNIGNCDTKQVRGCHGFSGYEYSVNKNLTLYWREGRLPEAVTIVAIDSDGGVLSLLSSSEDELKWLNNNQKLLEKIYSSSLD